MLVLRTIVSRPIFSVKLEHLGSVHSGKIPKAKAKIFSDIIGLFRLSNFTESPSKILKGDVNKVSDTI